MPGWSRHTGIAVALPLENVDTDQLIPARFMSTPRAEGYGRYLLHDLRRDGAGALRSNLALNRVGGASVLVARRNFGSGSSREAAVFALVDAGFRAVIAPGFGDIFAGNAVNNGLLAAQVTAQEAEALIGALADGGADCMVDLGAQEITLAGLRVGFALDPTRRVKLMNGWDDIDLTRSEAAAIAAFRGRRPAWTWPRDRPGGRSP